MNQQLDQLAMSLGLAAADARPLALAFGLSCAKRVEQLLEEPQVLACLSVLENYMAGQASADALAQAVQSAAQLANQHRGSRSIDGCGHAAVSASYGVAKALEGKALEAARYCAYAAVYASGGYAAVADQEAFEPELTWQVHRLKELALTGKTPPPCLSA